MLKGGRINQKKEMESNSKLVETKKAAKHGAHCGRAKGMDFVTGNTVGMLLIRPTAETESSHAHV